MRKESTGLTDNGNPFQKNILGASIINKKANALYFRAHWLLFYIYPLYLSNFYEENQANWRNSLNATDTGAKSAPWVVIMVNN